MTAHHSTSTMSGGAAISKPVGMTEQKRYSEGMAVSKKHNKHDVDTNKEQKRHSERGKREKMRSKIHSPLHNQLSMELSYCDSHSKKSKRSRDHQSDTKRASRKQFHLSLDKPSPKNKNKLSRSTTQPNLKKSQTKPSIQRSPTDLDLKNSSHKPSMDWQRVPVKSTKPSIKKHNHSSHEREPSMDGQRAPVKSTKPSKNKNKQSSHEGEPSTDWQRVPVKSTKPSTKKHKHSSHDREPSMNSQRVSPVESTKPSKKKHKQSSYEGEPSTDWQRVPASMGTSRASQTSPDESRSDSVSLSASQVSTHKGESKLRKDAQKKGESKATEAQKEQHTTKKTKPKKELQWSDRIRGKKAVDYSDVDVLIIWYSSQELLKLREREQDVYRGLSVGYSRACRDSSFLNVEGLFSNEQHLAMAKRRADYRKAVFDAPTGDAIAKKYREFSRPASKSAQKRAARLSSHVFRLWNAHQDDSHSDTWSDVVKEVLENDDSPPPPPSIYSQNCMAHRIKNRSPISSIMPTCLLPPSSSNENSKDGDEPKVWRSFKRHTVELIPTPHVPRLQSIVGDIERHTLALIPAPHVPSLQSIVGDIERHTVALIQAPHDVLQSIVGDMV